MQYSHSFTFDTKAAMSSRSPTVQPDGPRIASCVTVFICAPKKSGRYAISLRGSGVGCRETDAGARTCLSAGLMTVYDTVAP
jgi:hypothetical protein